MGNFYVTTGVPIGSSSVVEYLCKNRKSACVGPEQTGWTFFSEAESNSQNQTAIMALIKSMSSALEVPCISILNHDDDVLSIDLARGGDIVAEYNSCPGYFKEDPTRDELRPRIKNPEEICALRPGVAQDGLVKVLTEDGAEFVNALSVHEELAKIMDFPSYSIGLSFANARNGEFPGPPEDFRFL